MPIFDRDGISLYHDDCRNVLPRFAAETFDMVITDPPYLVSYAGRWGSDWGIIEGDSDPSWVHPVFMEISRVLKPDSLCLSFYGWPHTDIFFSAWRAAGLRPVSSLVFIKQRFGLGRFTRSQHELAFLLAKGSPKRPARAETDILEWQHPRPQVHPNEKPFNAICRIVGMYTSEDSLILDPFAGSGTTLAAARKLGRRAVGIEIDERHCENAALKLAQPMLPLTESAIEHQLFLMDMIGPDLLEAD
ncbi:MAG: hypothetical protein K1X67_25970 [Fimbriimonadaceae bacterium]|nr:hypothetical protein [Fimbriimonadaceae bacterium]